MFVSTTVFHEGSDRDLERRVTAFLAERSVPALRRLYVHSQRGVVTLRGHVHTFYEKQLSGNIARRVAGVVQLVDDVQVATAEHRSTPLRSRLPNRPAADLAGVAAGIAVIVDSDPVSPGIQEGPPLTSV